VKHYPSISGKIVDQDIWAFAKYDGSNIRAEIERKRGLNKFGSRKVLLGADHPYLGHAIETIRATFESELAAILKEERWEMMTCYFEYFGDRSFAGLHDPEDSTRRAALIDVDVYKKGLLHPREFVRIFSARVPTAPLLYRGKPNAEFLRSVKESTLEGMPEEGVVCKGNPLKNGYPPSMFKVKSNVWIEKVKARYGNDPAALADLL
jgi:hypothetical protein